MLSARTQRTSHRRVPLLSSHLNVHPRRPAFCVVQRTINPESCAHTISIKHPAMTSPQCETPYPPNATQNTATPYSGAVLGENVEVAHTSNHPRDLPARSPDPPSREGPPAYPPGLPARRPGLPARPQACRLRTVPQNVPPLHVGRQYTLGGTNTARHLPAQPAFQSGTILNPVWIDTARVGLGDAASPDTRPLEPFRLNPTEDPAWAGGLERGPPKALRSDRPVSLHCDGGAFNSNHWDAAIGAYRHLRLEPVTWTDDYLTRHWVREEGFRIREEQWLAAQNARVQPPMEPVLLEEQWPGATPGLLLLPAEHDDSGSDSGYSSSGELSALDDIMPGLAGLGGLVGLDDDALKASSNDVHVACEEIVEE
ncbi:uncharacterized protein B0H18DRAFT_985572 [Fomitopsis serialis]|uniref:uncharacterized protein n=1 Tax=Fomitopsis serialis TaxID=139415 RepID=UPI002007AB2C|nr:uncharacterized protein B0H18DRAFT_985572 [Neoantrodia serialis]KAH9932451.1 hypothetical protein B0H18DRAFT_985572 [Neoantrodia serialis]